MTEQPRIAAPALPQAPQPYSFPVLATIAPVVVSVAIWLITKSVFALVFAALGPAVAIASVVDAKWQARRRGRRERARFARETVEVGAEIAAAHASEREALDLLAGTARGALRRPGHDPERFSLGATDAILLTIGRGRVRSTLRLDGADPGGRHDGHADLVRTLRELAANARWLDDAPVRVDARLGIGVVGPPRVAAAIARAIVVQARYLLSPSDWSDEAGGPLERARYPSPAHPVISLSPRTGHVPGDVPGGAARVVTVALASTVDDLPPRVRVVISVTEGVSAAVVRHPDRELLGPLAVETVSARQADAFTGWLASAARQAGFGGGAALLPESVTLADLTCALGDPRPTDVDPGTLRAVFLAGRDGAMALDLVTDGPHAVIGGTTGSGKSELLVAWVVALAERYPPSRLAVLLVDFKGGASFLPLEPLPHSVGMISDLDQSAALRALSSLTAEIRYRERVLAAAGARSIDELAGGGGPAVELPRLLIVVDEFAAMVTEYPELHALFADLAARGRSLGIHLVLCTQRPSGAVRDSVLANSGLRISLRVNNRADSSAVIGTDAAASLPARPPGRALVSIAGEPPVAVQVALATESDTSRVAERWRGHPEPRRPWLGPLSDDLRSTSLDPLSERGSLPFARADLPAEQSQPTVGFSVASDGHLLAIGAPLSGKTTVLDTLGAAATGAGIAATWIASGGADLGESAERAWDWAVETLASIRGRVHGSEIQSRLVLIDDLDALLDRLPDDFRLGFIDLLCSILREGSAAGVTVVIAVQRLAPTLQSAIALCSSRLLLRMSSRQDHLLAGGVGEEYDPALPAGGGRWKGARIQVARVEVARVQIAQAPAGSVPAALRKREWRSEHPATSLDIGRDSLAVVSSRGAGIRQLAESSGARVVDLADTGADPRQLSVETGRERVVIIGDPDAWQAHWGAVAAMAARMPVLFHACTVTEFRTLTRSREVPPPVLDSRTTGVLFSGGAVRRVSWGHRGR